MYRIRTIFTGVAGAPWYSNMYFNPAEGDAPQSTALAVYDFWSACGLYISDDVDFQVDPVVPTIDPASGDTTDYTTVGDYTGAGTNAGGLLPVATQALVTLRTSATVRNRRLIGRIFIPGLTTASLGADGQFIPAATTAFTNAANALRSSSSGGNVEALSVWSRPKGPTLGVPVVIPGQVHVVTGASAAAKPSVLRSRRD